MRASWKVCTDGYVLLSDHNDESSKTVLEELEHIDDEADNVGIQVVKINNLELVRRP